MKYIKVIIIKETEKRTGTTDKRKDWTVFNFLAHETDNDGSRIPVTLSTRNPQVRDVVLHLLQKETLIPFDSIREFNKIETIGISDLLLQQPVQKTA